MSKPIGRNIRLLRLWRRANRCGPRAYLISSARWHAVLHIVRYYPSDRTRVERQTARAEKNKINKNIFLSKHIYKNVLKNNYFPVQHTIRDNMFIEQSAHTRCQTNVIFSVIVCFTPKCRIQFLYVRFKHFVLHGCANQTTRRIRRRRLLQHVSLRLHNVRNKSL